MTQTCKPGFLQEGFLEEATFENNHEAEEDLIWM